MRFLNFFFILFFSIYFLKNSYAQTGIPDSSWLKLTIDHTINLYSEALGKDFDLAKGYEYVEFNRLIRNHAFFLTDDWYETDIFYDGILFHDISLRYDIVKDQVVAYYNSINGYSPKVCLRNERIGWFEIEDHTFTYIGEDSVLQPQLYELIYNGKSKVVVRREKYVYEIIKNLELIEEFRERNFYYVRRNNIFMPVSSRKSLLKIGGIYKKEIKKMLKKNKIRFREDKEKAIKAVASFIDKKGVEQ